MDSFFCSKCTCFSSISRNVLKSPCICICVYIKLRLNSSKCYVTRGYMDYSGLFPFLSVTFGTNNETPASLSFIYLFNSDRCCGFRIVNPCLSVEQQQLRYSAYVLFAVLQRMPWCTETIITRLDSWLVVNSQSLLIIPDF